MVSRKLNVYSKEIDMTTLSFKSLIDQALELNNMSINKLATSIGVDRPWLQHALVGRRNLGYDNFEKIMSILNLSEHMNDELREAFAKEYFGSEDYNVIQNSIITLNTMSNFENSTTPQNFQTVSEQYHLTAKKREFFYQLCEIVNNEINRDNPLLYTTYALDIDCIRTMFLISLRNATTIVDYKHILYAEPNSSEQDIFTRFLYQCEFAGYGFNTYISRDGLGLSSSSPLPYFLLTHDVVILFSKDLELYVIERNPEFVTYMHRFFNTIYANALPFCSYMRSKEDFALFTSLMPQNECDLPLYYYDLSSNLCMAGYLDAEILSDAIPDIIEHKDFFIQGIASFFGLYGQTPHTAICENDSLLNFVEKDTAICDYHNVTFDILSISPKHKYKMLLKLKEAEEKNIGSHFILRSGKLQMPSFFHLNAYSYNLVLGFNFKILDISDGHSYIAAAVSQNPIVHKHIKNLSEYIVHSPYVYSTSRNYAIARIEDAIAYYKKKHNFD